MFSWPWSKDAKEKKAVAFALERMGTTLVVFRTPGGQEALERAAASPYLAGFLQGKLTGLIAYLVATGKLPKESANIVSGWVLLTALGKEAATHLSASIKAHDRSGSHEYKQGQGQGVKLAQYTVGIKDVRQEPDLARASAKAKEAQALDAQIFPDRQRSDEFMTMLLGLEILWFLDALYAKP